MSGLVQAKVIWKTKLGAYLYTDVDEKEGMCISEQDGAGRESSFAANLSDGEYKV